MAKEKSQRHKQEKGGQAWGVARNALLLEEVLVNGPRDWLDCQVGGLIEGRECRAKEFVYQGLVFMAAASVWVGGTLNKGTEPRERERSSPPFSSSAMLPSQVGGCGGCPVLIYTKVPEPRQLCHQFVPLPDLLTTGTFTVSPSHP